MNSHNDDQTERDVSTLLSAAEKDAVPPDEAFLARLPEHTLQAFMTASAQPPARSRRYRIMHSRTLKWLIPAAVAAAVVVAVALWPEAGRKGGPGGSGRVYGMADVPQLYRGARVLHVRGQHYTSEKPAPGEQPRHMGEDHWLDVENGRWRTEYRDLDCKDGLAPYDPQGRGYYRYSTYVSDGDYHMDLSHSERTVEFTRLTPFQRRLKSRMEQQSFLTNWFAHPDHLNTYVKTGAGQLSGRSFDIWEQTLPTDYKNMVLRFKVWLSPTTGDLGRFEAWSRGPEPKEDWWLVAVFDTFERDVVPPPGIFATDPPSGYTVENTKKTAPVADLDQCTAWRIGLVKVKGHIGFMMPDGTILFAWSVVEPSPNAPPAAVFQNLVPGGPLPELPVVLDAFALQPPVGDLNYPGRHLAHTHRAGRYYEWSIYVPEKAPPPRSRPCGYTLLYHVNSSLVSAPERTSMGWGSGDFLDIPNAADFNEFVCGAMAELSDGGVVPEHVTYDNVRKLSRQIRDSLSK